MNETKTDRTNAGQGSAGLALAIASLIIGLVGLLLAHWYFSWYTAVWIEHVNEPFNLLPRLLPSGVALPCGLAAFLLGGRFRLARRLLAGAAIIVSCAGVVLLVLASYWPAWHAQEVLERIRGIASDDIAAVRVFVRGGRIAQEPDLNLEATDNGRISALQEILRGSRIASEHMCGSIGTIEIVGRNKKSTVLEILPGHNSKYYEYRYAGGLFRIERASFLEFMTGIGSDRERLEYR